MTKSRFRNTVLGIGATAAALALGYFGVQQLGRNNMFTIAAAVGGAGAISYVLQKPSQPEAPAAPIKAQRKGKKS
ncbi:hypothetical protein [Nostoc sphaeroides]|jgi:uncharacterized membrane protein YeaQ/YmgE (transglycosylase-associated protein family)|uniref:Uncharacterized protein n=1 Tax=Nostoc sphaeroides CCNUC1 TaxID=2653204 RepID=A0A5P8WJV0_9NOSO|nr:hypothetical protein [Nostoc sphaeroides]QFS52850.1 hypothetical protein GXM_10114 [Nostoc sphaeroides CCNUC1]